MTVTGSIAVASRRNAFVWTSSAAVWQAELKVAEKAGKERVVRLFSPFFDGERLRLLVNLNSKIEGYCGVFLAPTQTARPMTAGFDFEFAVLEASQHSQRKLRDSLSVDSHRFLSEDDDSWGRPKALTLKLIKKLDAADKIIITTVIKHQDPTSPPLIPLALFNNPHNGDVAFHIASADAWIFALKPVLVARSAHFRSLLDSDFVEGSSRTLLDPDTSFDPPSDVRLGDVDEFANVFSREEPSKAGEAQQMPGQASPPALYDDETPDSDTTMDTDASTSVTKVEAPVITSASVERKRYHRIEVADCSYSTFIAHLYWIYYGEISFAPSRAAALMSPPEQPELRDSSASMTPSSETDVAQVPLPCDAHAMYRLADRYMQDGLCEIAKSAVVDGLTPETAVYEAFSALSRDYQDLQDAAVEYTVKNVDAVRRLSGWKRMLELLNEGRLPGGADVLDKILAGVAEAQGTDKS